VIDRYLPGDTPVHRLAPEAKVAGTLVFVVAVVVTPRPAVWAFGVEALIVGAVAAAAHVPRRALLLSLRIELPFVAFAVLLPFIGADPRVHVAGLALSEPGLWAAFAILAKGTLGVAASVVLAATTSPPDLVRALERLHLPKVLVTIAAFMVRYLAILASEAERMRIARQSRGYEPRWWWQAAATATSIGTLFVRGYERGERVHLAMCSRGYDGTMPDLAGRHAGFADWGRAAIAPLAAVAVATIALVAS
jgi:cobalt/nickel transport system permease protein